MSLTVREYQNVVTSSIGESQ